MSDKILKFYGTWCGPCKALSAVMTGIDLGVDVEEVDIDEKNEVAVQYAIKSVPTLVYLKDGSEVSRLVGMQQPVKLKTWVAGLQ